MLPASLLMENFKRRKFLQSLAALTAVTGVGGISFAEAADGSRQPGLHANRFKISLNAYSFNKPLISGETNLERLLEFCAVQGFDAIDITGYYFPDYPQVPNDEYVFNLKRKAHRFGVEISGTGVRNDFTYADRTKIDAEISLVKSWIEVAAKLGAPVIRIFTGKESPAGESREVVLERVTAAISSCVDHGKKYGVVVAVQNHNDFIKTAEQALQVIHKVNSDWFGLVLDTGSFVTNEPYSEIEKMTSYAVNWQVKEKLNYEGKETLMDLVKLFSIVKASGYRGYLPIETLSAGDPFVIVPVFLKEVREALDKATAFSK